VFIIGVTIGGSGRGRETLDMGMLEINNQYCIRKKRMGHTLEGVCKGDWDTRLQKNPQIYYSLQL